jgi:Raf kinase inhibitor-like YbhB/YbcL family protein
MPHAAQPQHSGAAISILKVEPRTEGPLALTSEAVDVDGRIAERHTALGGNLSPPLRWTAVPDAGAYALIVEDPDAPRDSPFIHWLAWNIPGHLTALPEGLANEPRLVSPQGMIQGRNDSGGPGWFGPKPPAGHGVHHYHFQLFALDGRLGLHPDADVRSLVDGIKGRTLAEGELVGTYEVPAPMTQ